MRKLRNYCPRPYSTIIGSTQYSDCQFFATSFSDMNTHEAPKRARRKDASYLSVPTSICLGIQLPCVTRSERVRQHATISAAAMQDAVILVSTPTCFGEILVSLSPNGAFWPGLVLLPTIPTKMLQARASLAHAKRLTICCRSSKANAISSL